MPATLRVALGLLWAQFAALTLVLLLFAYRVAGAPTPLGFYVTAFGLALVISLYVAARLLQRRRMSGRAAATALQLLFLAPVYYMITSGFWVGWLLAAWIVAVTAFLFAPGTGRALS
ncbi:hypothetical protein [Allorhizocola rhizosphaerae]|uniref:hypothetical protein n=1 Tax=Allorhizocola rhizosphaerae TaxID=1872709 RepID=UPI0013C3738F|nr:hypothetical protein [Allorhizocola rhizosphaerae]